MIPQPQFDMSAMGGGMGNAGGGMGGMGGLGGMINPGTLGMFAGMFGGGNAQNGNAQQYSAAAAMPYLNHIGEQMPQYFQPYINGGNHAWGELTNQYDNLLNERPQVQGAYNQLINDPTSVMNKIGSTFQQSPGYQYEVNQALGAANRAAAAGGMVGSPAEQQGVANTVNGMANQDYYNYLNHGLAMYNTGLQGANNLYGMGLQGNMDMSRMGLSASNSLTDDLMSQYLSQASDAYAGGANGGGDQGGGSGMGGIFSGALSGAATGSAFGPWGAVIGGGIGALGGYMSSKK